MNRAEHERTQTEEKRSHLATPLDLPDNLEAIEYRDVTRLFATLPDVRLGHPEPNIIHSCCGISVNVPLPFYHGLLAEAMRGSSPGYLFGMVSNQMSSLKRKT